MNTSPQRKSMRRQLKTTPVPLSEMDLAAVIAALCGDYLQQRTRRRSRAGTIDPQPARPTATGPR